MICEKCGYLLRVGDFPFCRGNQTDHAPGVTGVNGDECDITQEMGAPQPIRFRSKAERRRWLKENGLVQCDTKSAKGSMDFASRMDPVTLENARILVSRPGALKGDDEAPVRMNLTYVSGEL